MKVKTLNLIQKYFQEFDLIKYLNLNHNHKKKN